MVKRLRADRRHKSGAHTYNGRLFILSRSVHARDGHEIITSLDIDDWGCCYQVRNTKSSSKDIRRKTLAYFKPDLDPLVLFRTKVMRFASSIFRSSNQTEPYQVPGEEQVPGYLLTMFTTRVV